MADPLAPILKLVSDHDGRDDAHIPDDQPVFEWRDGRLTFGDCRRIAEWVKSNAGASAPRSDDGLLGILADSYEEIAAGADRAASDAEGELREGLLAKARAYREYATALTTAEKQIAAERALVQMGVDAVEVLIAERREKDREIADLTRERDEARSENLRLRAALANSKDPCIYCQLPAEQMALCKAGFPGCSRMDDISGCPEFGAMMNEHMLQDEIADEKARADALQAENERLLDRLSTIKSGHPARASDRG